jgi:hypothetical protein
MVLDLRSRCATTAARTLSQELLIKLGRWSSVKRPALRSYERRLKSLLALSMPKRLVKSTFGTRYGPLPFWKEICRQYQFERRAPNCIVDAVAGRVNSHSRMRRFTNIKRNSLPNLDFFASCDTE